MDEELDDSSSVLDGVEEVGEKTKDGAKSFGKAIAKAAKAAGKAIIQLFKWIGIALASVGWEVILVVVIVVLLAAMVGGIVAVTTALFNGTYENGVYTPGSGVKGDTFYGERYFYYDPTYSSNELANIYSEFTLNLLKTVNNNKFTINVDFTGSSYGNQMLDSITLEFASALSGVSDNDSIKYHTNIIDHYGFTISEENTVITEISDFLVDNSLVASEITKEIAFVKIKEVFDEDYSYMKNVCDKIIIRDYLTGGEDSGISGIEKKNYFGAVFMPNKDAVINDVSYVFILDDAETANAVVKYNNSGVETTIEEASADDTWFKNGSIETVMEVNLQDYPISAFEAIDQSNMEYLVEGKSLFTILRDNKFLTYFKDTLGNYSKEALLRNIKTNNYIYIELDAQSFFIVTDAYIEY